MSTSWHYQLHAKACRGQLDVYQLVLPARYQRPARRQGLPWPARCLPAGTISSTPRLAMASLMSTSRLCTGGAFHHVVGRYQVCVVSAKTMVLPARRYSWPSAVDLMIFGSSMNRIK